MIIRRPRSAESDGDPMARYAPLLVMLFAYLVLTFLMNVVFVIYDDRFGEASIRSFSIRSFPVRTAGYWILLLLPFFVVPPVALFVRRIFERPIIAVLGWIPEFRVLDYLVITCACYAIVVTAMFRADAWGLLWVGSDAIATVEARFELLDRLYFFERCILQSVLMFLTVYSMVRALRSHALLWFSLFVVNLFAMMTLLVFLNMKWPVVVLAGSVVSAAALFGKHRLIYSVIGVVGMIGVYMLIASVILRLPQPGGQAELREALHSKASAPLTLKGTTTAAVSSSRNLAVTGLIRMALPYPFYYTTFANEGQICGTLLDRLRRRENPCQPSLLIYNRMFGDDGFADRGTAPAAFHITGFALGGWSGAIIESILAAIVVGLFMAVPAGQSAITGTIVVMGILAAYFFSQLPFEGPIVYDHGVLWWGLLIVAYALVRRLALWRRAPSDLTGGAARQ